MRWLGSSLRKYSVAYLLKGKPNATPHHSQLMPYSLTCLQPVDYHISRLLNSLPFGKAVVLHDAKATTDECGNRKGYCQCPQGSVKRIRDILQAMDDFVYHHCDPFGGHRIPAPDVLSVVFACFDRRGDRKRGSPLLPPETSDPECHDKRL